MLFKDTTVLQLCEKGSKSLASSRGSDVWSDGWSLRDLFPISSDQFPKHPKTSLFIMKTLTRVGSASDLSGAK